MSRRKSNILTSDNLDSKLLYFAIIAIVITNFIVRVKLFTNVRAFNMGMLSTVSNFFTYYKLVWILFIAILLLLAIIFRMYKYKQKLEINYILLGTGLIIFASLISFILDPIKEVTIWGFYARNNGLLAYICLFLLIYLISNLKVQTRNIFFLLHAVNIASILLVIIGIFQFFGLDMMNSAWFKQIYVPNEYKYLLESINITQFKFTGTEYFWSSSILGQFNYYGAYCSSLFPLITVFAIKEDVYLKKAAWVIGSIMLFIGTILAQSLGSIITMLATILIIPIFLVDRRNYKSFLLLVASYSIISAVINRLTDWKAFQDVYKYMMQLIDSKLIVIVLLMAVIYILIFVVRKRIYKHRYVIVSILIITTVLISIIGYVYVVNIVAEQNMGMLSGRGHIWHYSNEVIKKNFIFGYGPDNLYYNYPQLNPYQQEFISHILIDKPHNMYLQVMIDTGIFGLIGFMILLVGMLLKLNKAIDFENDILKNTYLKALMLVIAAYMLQGLINDNHLTVQPVIYLLMGIGASLIKQTLDKAKLAMVKE